jgi:hypothetical protein
MISTIEAALIKLNMPLWNTAVDGFGNHDPGSGRYQQAKSDWIHRLPHHDRLIPDFFSFRNKERLRDYVSREAPCEL